MAADAEIWDEARRHRGLLALGRLLRAPLSALLGRADAGAEDLETKARDIKENLKISKYQQIIVKMITHIVVGEIWGKKASS